MRFGNSYLLHFDRLGPDGNPYMRRFKVIDCAWFAVRFHRIYRPDDDRDLHDHPWSFLTFVLSGGYMESRPTVNNKSAVRDLFRYFPSVAFRRATDLHQIQLVWPRTLTLVICGPRCREWGFQTPSGWIHWRTYLKSPEQA